MFDSQQGVVTFKVGRCAMSCAHPHGMPCTVRDLSVTQLVS